MICLRVYVCMCTLIRSYQIFICVLLSLRITPFCWVFRKLFGTFYIFFYLYIFTSRSFCLFLLLFLQYAYNLYAFHAFHSHLRNSLRRHEWHFSTRIDSYECVRILLFCFFAFFSLYSSFIFIITSCVLQFQFRLAMLRYAHPASAWDDLVWRSITNAGEHSYVLVYGMPILI